MALHLKDKELEKKLNELSNGEFSKILNETDMKNPNCICFTIDKKEDIELSVFLSSKAIEPEYDPHTWNEYPTVTPPEDIWMRFETKVGEGFMAVFENGNWFDCNGQEIDKSEGRFRPWED